MSHAAPQIEANFVRPLHEGQQESPVIDRQISELA